MAKLDNHIAFVKEQLSAQEGLAAKYESQPYRAGRHLATAQKFRALLDDLAALSQRPNDSLASGQPNPKKMSLSLAEIEDLPDDLIKELNISETDRQEMIIEDIISKSGGVLSLDRILVELYKRTGEVHKRNTLVSRLYRMAQRGIIFNVPSRKGVYSTYEMSEADAAKLFGGDEVERGD